jgi:coenzyme F420-0:L-glutamate ligase/coenzyme F420-1:gamma-L-glutamate ligase
VRVEVLPVEGVAEVRPGDDLAAALSEPLRAAGVRDGDIVVVTQKVVSKAEGRVVPEEGDGRAGWVERETRRVVARRDDIVIAETEHGFVCANAGVDASNVEAGFLTLLPRDPDGSAERLRSVLETRLGVDVAVVITDTFGRAWRRGVVNVAIGCAGLPSLVDLRGTVDHNGRELEATIVALADEVAAASGLVMGKAARVPAAIARGIETAAPNAPARELIRPPEEDLFRESPLQSVSAPRTTAAFGPGEVRREAVVEAVRAAASTTDPPRGRPWSFTAVVSPAAKRRLAEAAGGVTATGESILSGAPLVLVPWTRLGDATGSPDADRSHAERTWHLLWAGAAIERLMLALHAQGYASRWTNATLSRQEETREALGMPDGWFALGAVAVGVIPPGAEPSRPALDVGDLLREL